MQNAVTEIERVLCFTDVPCGAMKFEGEEPELVEPTVCRSLERALCFSDLKDVDHSQVQAQPNSMRAIIDTKKEEDLKSGNDTDSCTASLDVDQEAQEDNPALDIDSEEMERQIQIAAMMSGTQEEAPEEQKPQKKKKSWFGRKSSTKKQKQPADENKKREMRSRQSLWRHAQECEYDSQAFDESSNPSKSSTNSKSKKWFSFRKSNKAPPSN